MPLFYLCNILTIPLIFYGYSDISTSNLTAPFIGTFLALSTIANGGLGFPIDGPSWTVCTLVWLWIAFPFLLVIAQRMTDRPGARDACKGPTYLPTYLWWWLLFSGSPPGHTYISSIIISCGSREG